LGAHRSGIKTVLLPEGNRKDVDGVDAGLPFAVREDLKIVWIPSLISALAEVFPQGTTDDGSLEGDLRNLQRSRL
jgi:ATP-dependent Lon protease